MSTLFLIVAAIIILALLAIVFGAGLFVVDFIIKVIVVIVVVVLIIWLLMYLFRGRSRF